MFCIFPSSLHPFMPLVASCSGQRQFPWPGHSDDEDEEKMMTSSDIRENNGLVLWWAGPLGSSNEQGQEEGSTAWETIICNFNLFVNRTKIDEVPSSVKNFTYPCICPCIYHIPPFRDITNNEMKTLLIFEELVMGFILRSFTGIDAGGRKFKSQVNYKKKKKQSVNFFNSLVN